MDMAPLAVATGMETPERMLKSAAFEKKFFCFLDSELLSASPDQAKARLISWACRMTGSMNR